MSIRSRAHLLPLCAALVWLGCPSTDGDDDSVAPGDDDDATAAGDDDDTTPGDDDDSGSPGDDDDSATGDDDDDPWPAFTLGVEYTELGLAEVYADAGAAWAKTRLEVFAWGAVEPEPPVAGVHTYDFGCTDALIAEYQGAGMHVQSYLTSRSEWGSVDAGPLGDTDIAPAADHMDDYRAWVRALIERYDGDGIDDMPGLTEPVRYWVVGGEWSGFWPSDDHGGYLTMAEATAEEARAAYADVRLGTIPFLMWEVFEGNEPTDEEIDARLAGEPLMHNSFEGIHAILDRPDLFDYVCVHSLGDYTEIGPTLSWFRGQMSDRGYSRPIWFDDAFPLGGLANFWGFPPHYPVTAEQQGPIWALLEDIALLEEPAHSEAVAWLRALAAAGTVKKVVTALGEGAAGIQIGNTEDWMHDEDTALRHSFTGFIGAAAAYGMIDVTHDGGYQVCDVRTPGPPRPAYRNLELLTDKLGDAEFDYTSTVGGTEGVRGYRFQESGWTLWVLWNEAGVLRLPGEVEEPVEHVLLKQCTPSTLIVTHAVTDVSAPEPVVEEIELSGDCTASVEVTSVPIFVELFP
jgi:hypothetical protein